MPRVGAASLARLTRAQERPGRDARPVRALAADPLALDDRHTRAAFAESLRQELIPSKVRVSVVEPGTVATELVTRLRDGVRQTAQGQVHSIEPLRPEDIAEGISYIVMHERRVAINELLLRAAEQLPHPLVARCTWSRRCWLAVP
jgi:hypothetical protein